MTAPKRILIARFSSLGDLVRMVRFPAALRRLFPDCELELLTSRIGAALYRDVAVFSAIHVYDPGAPLRDRLKTIAELRRQRYDLYLDVHGNRLGYCLGKLVPARRKQRVNHPLLRRLPLRPTRPRTLRQMLAAAGYEPGQRDLDQDPSLARLAVPEPVRQQAAARLREAGWDGQRKLVVLAGGSSARWGSKRWGADRFRELASRLIAEGCTIVAVGDASEQALSQQIVADLPHAMNLAGQTTLAQMLATCSLAAAAVTNDSGPMHMAAVVGAPTLALFGSTDYKRHGPDRFYGPPHRALSAHVSCSPCYHGTCPLPRHECMLAISVDQVHATLHEMMNNAATTHG